MLRAQRDGVGLLGRLAPVVLQDGTSSYVYGLGLISQTDGSGSQSYLLGNWLGRTEHLTDGVGTGAVTARRARLSSTLP